MRRRAQRLREMWRTFLTLFIVATTAVPLPFVVTGLTAHPPGWLQPLLDKPVRWALAILLLLFAATLFLGRPRSVDRKSEIIDYVDADLGDLSIAVENRIRDELGRLEPLVAELVPRIRVRANPANGEIKNGRRRSTQIHDVPDADSLRRLFDDSDRHLLILGIPGVGKTVALVKLGQGILARYDDFGRVPVLLRLTTWRPSARRFDEWVAEAIKETYSVSPAVATALVNRRRIIPLLDGLEDIPPQYRRECAAAISAFRENIGLAMAVATRIDVWNTLRDVLDAGLIVDLQPPGRDEVKELLLKLNTPPSLAARSVSVKDRIWWELMCSRFVLAMIVRISTREPDVNLYRAGPLESRRRGIIDQYVQTVLTHRPDARRYPRNSIIRWLSWLGNALRVDNETEVRPDRLDFRWLARSKKELDRMEWAPRPPFSLSSLLTIFILIVVPAIAMFSFNCPAEIIQRYGLFGPGSMIVFGMTMALTSVKVHPVVQARMPWSIFLISLGVIAFLAGAALVLDIFLGSTNSIPPMVGALTIVMIYVMGMPHPEGVGLGSTQPRPMMELRQSHRVGLRAALMAAVVPAALAPFAFEVTRHPGWALLGTAFLAIQVFAVVWYRQGGAAVLQYVEYGRTLRKRGVGCVRYNRFLEYAADALLLRRVGMGYQFIHHYELEYFADQWSESQKIDQRGATKRVWATPPKSPRSS